MFLKLTLILFLFCNSSFARIIEEIIEVPVSVSNSNFSNNPKFEQKITVTIWRDDSVKKSPYLLFSHGRAGTDQERGKFGRSSEKRNSEYFVSKGFTVILPTRIGYGVSGGPDADYSGACGNKNYLEARKVAIDQSKQVLNHVFDFSYIDRTKGIVVGQSVGGFTTIGLSAENIPGLKGAINFAGGDGGDPIKSAEKPCGDYLIKDTFAKYGASNKVPTLWLYSVNDKFWGEQLPKDWFAAFQKAGGKGQFISLPAYKEDGHSIFRGDLNAWKNDFEKFIKEIGF
ncbi:COG0412 Dienelactone hydrolase and related enzymes [Candidatus Pelagibacterales bacterium]